MKTREVARVREGQARCYRGRSKVRFRNLRLLNASSFALLFVPCLLLNVALSTLIVRRARETLSATIDCTEHGTLWDITWSSRRTILFTALWSTHKLRNAAVYFCFSTRRLFILNNMVYYTLTCPDVFYDARYEILFQAPNLCISHRCLKCYGASHYVYADFVLQTFEAVTNSLISPPKPTPQGKVAVLVEPRQHPLLEYTVKQVMLTLGPTWSLQIFVSSSNEDFVRKIFRVYQNDTGQNIVLTRLQDFGLDDLSKYGNRVQSAFSAHEAVYKAILSEYILWFQLDVVMRRSPNDSWLNHAYVGAEWKGCEYPRCSKHTCQNICGGGNSGLSLRRRSILRRVATRGTLPEHIWGLESNDTNALWRGSNFADVDAHFANDDLHDNSENLWFEDDLQLSYKLSRLELLPPGHIPPRFALAQALPVEGLCKTNPSGLHKPWDTPWISPFTVMQLLAEPFEHTHRRLRAL